MLPFCPITSDKIVARCVPCVGLSGDYRPCVIAASTSTTGSRHGSFDCSRIVDAADAGVKFHRSFGIFGSRGLTYLYATWHEMVERSIESSGVADVEGQMWISEAHHSYAIEPRDLQLNASPE
jgi:hypothetical protein